MTTKTQTIKCNYCQWEMNVLIGSLGYGPTLDCPHCNKMLIYDIVREGWHADNKKKGIHEKIMDLIVSFGTLSCFIFPYALISGFILLTVFAMILNIDMIK